MQTIHVTPSPQVPVIVNPAPARRVNVQTVRSLAITQLIIGILTTLFGIAVIASLSLRSWTTNSGAGIWGGIWILVTGALGISHSRNLNSSGLNGVYMSFSIISTCISFLIGIFFVYAVAFYALLGGCGRYIYPYYYDYYGDCEHIKNKNVGLGIYVPMLIMMVVEFFVSIVAAVYCCQNNNSCCGGQQTAGVIIQPQQPVYITSTQGYAMSNPPIVCTTAGQFTQGQFPQGLVPQAYPGQAPQAYPGQVPQAYPPGQVPMYQQQYQPYPPPQTNVTYSQAPPAYSEEGKQ